MSGWTFKNLALGGAMALFIATQLTVAAKALFWDKQPLFPAFSKPAATKPAFTEFCISKVTYIQFDNAVVTKVRPDGKIWTCGGV